jgi:Sedlin, N-terminal conserved region
MSLLGIAIIGKSNEPLYLCDCTRLQLPHDGGINKAAAADSSTDATTTTEGGGYDNSDDDDLFGFIQATACLGQRQSLPLERQFMMHAALDRLEELIGASKPDGTMPLRPSTNQHHHHHRSSGSSSSSTAASNLLLSANNAHWLGLLTVQDGDCAVYGHVVVPTNLKFLALVQVGQQSSSSAPNNNNNGPVLPLAAKTAKAVRKLLASLHGNFIDYVMNPFSKIAASHSHSNNRGGGGGGLALIDSPRFDANVRETVANYAREQQEQQGK